MYTVLITGGTGMIGTALSRRLLNEGYNVIILSRNPKETAASHPLGAERNFFRSSGNLFYSKWDVKGMTIDASALAEADFIIHLAGAGVAAQRWSEARKREIRESRTRSSELLLKALREQPNKVKAVISASAIGYYGPDNGTPFTEEDKPAGDFLGSTCQQWEQSIDPVSDLGKRLVKLRLGIVLANEGGALKEFRKPLRMGVAAILGDGQQMVSWVHIDDICRAFIHAMEQDSMQGVYNLTAPEPIPNRTLTLTLAKKMNGSLFIPLRVPSFVLKAMLGEMSIEVLKSATVSSRKIQSAGFKFQYPDIDQALTNLSS
jgi:uncharacterized protein (TIGR01777 family)